MKLSKVHNETSGNSNRIYIASHRYQKLVLNVFQTESFVINIVKTKRYSQFFIKNMTVNTKNLVGSLLYL